jgi:hypothetical protein
VKVVKMSISFAPELGGAVREAARREGVSLSAWLADAAERKLRAVSLTAFFDDWQAEHGAFTEEELAQAQRDLGFGGDT